MPSLLVEPDAPRIDRHAAKHQRILERRERQAAESAAGRAVWNRNPWKWFFSLRVGIAILAILAVASMVGTAIDPLERAQALVFYTWWYKLLLLALAVNMSCATVQTTLAKTLPSRRMRVQQHPKFFEAAKPNAVRDFSGTADDVAAAFRRQGCEVLVEGNAGMARKGWIGRLGGAVSHVGLVAVLLTGFCASWLGQEGYVRIPEGRSVSTMTLRDGNKTEVPLGFTITLDDFSTGYFPRTRVPSHFVSTVSAADGEGLLYRGPVEVNHSPTIKGWNLHQTSYEEMPKVSRQEMLLTSPAGAVHKLEASYGQAVPIPGTPERTFMLEPGGAWKIREGAQVIAEGRGTHEHGSELALKVERFEPDFVVGADKKAASRSQEPNNPAILVTVLSDGAPAARQWIFARENMKQFSHSPNEHFSLEFASADFAGEKPAFTVELSDGHSGALIGRTTLGLGEQKVVAEAPAAPAEDLAAGWQVVPGQRVSAHATVLTLSRNPIFPIVYAACGIMMIGLILGFFVRRREVWFRIDPAAGKLYVAARYRHPSDEFDRLTSAALDSISAPASQSSAQGALA